MLTLMTGSSAIAGPPTITIDAADALGPVDPMCLGQVVMDTDPKAVKSPDQPPTPEPIRRFSIDRANGMWDPIAKTSSPNALAKLKGLKPGVIRYFAGRELEGIDWKRTIGPINQRSGQRKFGLMEFLQVCEEVGAEPNITFHDSLFCEPVGDRPASDKADMVEFLNAPATPDHPWAMKRAKYGHPEPYGVKYFEVGNECWMNSHYLAGKSGTLTPEQYVTYANDTIDAMKAVDDSIQCGIVLRNYGYAIDSPWNRVVLSGLGDKADFAVSHTYAIAHYRNDMDVDQALMMNATLSSTDQIELWVDQLQAYIQEITGKELPLAITEYNALFVQYKPIPFRFSYGSALFSADLLRVWLQPSKKILMANYWHYIGSYWGMIQGKTDDTLTERPAYPLFALWTEHFGDEIVATQVQNSPTITCDGFLRAAPSRGDTLVVGGKQVGGNLVTANRNPLQSPSGDGYTITANPRTNFVEVQLSNLTTDAFPTLISSMPVPPNAGKYRLSYEARLVNPDLTGTTRFGLGVGDARGWKDTKSAAGIDNVGLSTDWTLQEKMYTALSDTENLTLLARLRCKKAAATGTVEFRNIKITPYTTTRFPAYNALTACSSLSDDGKTLYVIIFNKDADKPVTTNIDLQNFAISGPGQMWQVTSTDGLTATNIGKPQVTQSATAVKINPAGTPQFKLTLPPASMTACEFTRP